MLEDEVFIWTEAFNCSEILPPFLKSFTHHHDFTIHIATSKNEFQSLPEIENVRFLPIKDTLSSKLTYTNEKAILRGFKKGHLGTARLWNQVIRNRRETFLIHLDADTVFLGDVISPLIAALKQNFDFVGTRRPYLHRGYRTIGTDARLLDQHPDASNTDIIGMRRNAIPGRYSPLFTRWIRGKRPIRYPVVDFFDPVLFQALRKRKQVQYLDSPERGNQSIPNENSHIFTNRISFAAVGSGLNFLKNPEVTTSPGYRAYAISSYALYAKYLLDMDLGLPTLSNSNIEERLKRLNQRTWTLNK